MFGIKFNTLAVCAAVLVLPALAFGAAGGLREKAEKLEKDASFEVGVLDGKFKEFDVGITTKTDSGGFSFNDIYVLLLNNVRNKKLLLLYKYVQPDADGEGNLEDYFKIAVLPRFAQFGFERIALVADTFVYDSDEDPPARDYLRGKAKRFAESQDDTPYEPGEFADKYAHCKLPKGEKGGDGDAMNKMGYLSLKKLRDMGEKGDCCAYEIYARALLGMVYESDGPIDTEKGMEVLNALAEKKHIGAIITLSDIYGLIPLKEHEPRDGGYLKKRYGVYWRLLKYADKDKALAMLKKAADLGDASRLYRFFTMLASEGKTGEMEAYYDKFKNLDEHDKGDMETAIAMAYFGYSLDEMSMGCMGYGMALVPDFGNVKEIKNPQKAWEWAQKCKKGGFLKVHMLLSGIGMERDEKAATELVQKMYYGNIMECSAYLGYAYANGIGVEKDEGKSKLYWDRFFEYKGHENAYAVVDAAKRFYNGFGYPKDKAAAIWILETAAADSNRYYVIDPLSSLAKLYEGKFDPSDAAAGKAGFYRKKFEEVKKAFEEEK